MTGRRRGQRFANWIPDRVRVGYDPVNQAIVYTHSNSEGQQRRIRNNQRFKLQLTARRLVN